MRNLSNVQFILFFSSLKDVEQERLGQTVSSAAIAWTTDDAIAQQGHVKMRVDVNSAGLVITVK